MRSHHLLSAGLSCRSHSERAPSETHPLLDPFRTRYFGLLTKGTRRPGGSTSRRANKGELATACEEDDDDDEEEAEEEAEEAVEVEEQAVVGGHGQEGAKRERSDEAACMVGIESLKRLAQLRRESEDLHATYEIISLEDD